MHEQLDLFGGESSNPKEAPKKKFALVPPKKVVEESIASDAETNLSEEVHNHADSDQEESINEIPIAKEVQDVQDFVEEILSPDTAIISDQERSENTTSSSSINIPEDATLYSKQYYAISEVAFMFNVNISLLRFWEKEFDILKPRKNKKGDRLFRPEDIKNLKLIYFLLREKKYTIEGARTFIKKGKKVNEHFEAIETLKNVRKMLTELKDTLS